MSLAYDLGAQVTADVFRETFAMQSSNNWNGTTQTAHNLWSTVGAGNVRGRANLASNRTVPITLANCSNNGREHHGDLPEHRRALANIERHGTGPNLPSGRRSARSTNGTTFAMTANATRDGRITHPDRLRQWPS